MDNQRTLNSSLSGEIAKAGGLSTVAHLCAVDSPPAFADGQSKRESPKMASRSFQF